MFARVYFAAAFFGPRYFGQSTGSAPPPGAGDLAPFIRRRRQSGW